jgi:hypothetical protein
MLPDIGVLEACTADWFAKGRVVTTQFVALCLFCVILVVEGTNPNGRDAMFLKRLERRKNGKQHTYSALVESIRTARSSRHRVVAYLGELKKSERDGWARLGQRLDGKQRPQRSFFDPPHRLRRIDEVAQM